jgi:hypothetical protein
MSMSKNYEEAFPGKIAVGADGPGAVSPELVAERARELAKADGRLEVNAADEANARAELLSHGEFVPAPPEVDDPALENLTAWDEPLDARGGAVESMPPLDEANIAEQLVQEGVSEADHDQRVSASEDEPPEDL